MLCRLWKALAMTAGLSVATVASAQPVGMAPPGFSPQGMPGMPPMPGMGDFAGPPPGQEINPDLLDSTRALGPTEDFRRFWFTGEYIFAGVSSATLPTLVTRGPLASGGVLGALGTQAAFGGTQDFGGISGFRFGGGFWIDGCRAFGLEWGVTFLPEQTRSFSSNGSGSDVLARPFFDTVLQTQNSRLIAAPGQFIGSVDANYSSYFWNADLGAVMRVYESSNWSLEHTIGARYFSLEDRLRITDNTRALPGGTLYYRGAPVFSPDASVSVMDYYSMINRWYGGAAGLRLNFSPGRFTGSVAFRLGVGANLQSLSTDGITTLTGTPAGTLRTSPGLSTAATSPGNYTRTQLSYAPELMLRGGYAITDRLSVNVGYQFLTITNMARVADQFNSNVNPGSIPSSQLFNLNATTNRNVQIQQSDFTLHGFTAGLSLTF